MTPKFLFGFFKRFYLTWGRWFKFFLQKNSPFQIFFSSLWQRFYLDSPKICLWSWRFLLFIWTQDKMFFTWENNFWKSFWICTMAFGIILYHFQQISLAMALVQIHSPKTFPHLWIMICIKSSKLNLPMWLFPFIFYSNKFLPSFLALGDLQRNSTFGLVFWPQTSFPS